MKEKICPYCKKAFQASRYHPDQAVCTSNKCQRRRRADYHRKKLVGDPLYREQCRDSQKNWRERNRGYMKQYRAGLRAEGRAQSQNPILLEELRRLLDLLRNTITLSPALEQVGTREPWPEL
jgi:hypothetical protein